MSNKQIASNESMWDEYYNSNGPHLEVGPWCKAVA